jgi:hypothetical protein
MFPYAAHGVPEPPAPIELAARVGMIYRHLTLLRVIKGKRPFYTALLTGIGIAPLVIKSFLSGSIFEESRMINFETKSKLRLIITNVGASIFACALGVPALALQTPPVSNPSRAGVVNAAWGEYDRSAPLAGEQYAGEEDENEVQPYGGEEAEHIRHEQMEHEGREELHHLGEEGEEHAERLKNRVDEERAEHERHEMEEQQEPEHHKDID